MANIPIEKMTLDELKAFDKKLTDAKKLRGEKPEPDEVFIYAQGLCQTSVCVDKNMQADEIERRVNEMSPTGIQSDWKMNPEGFWEHPGKNGIVCNEDKNRKHWVLSC